MIIECAVAKTYEIDDSLLEEYVKWILETGLDPDFYDFIEWFSDTHDLEDMQINNFREWCSINGNSDIKDEFENIIENYYND